MATQPADALDGAEEVTQAIDYEIEARKMGWRPADEYKGDPDKHQDAQTFYNRGMEMMPFLQATNATLRDKIGKMEKQLKQVAKFATKAETAGYERAMDEIKSRQEAAVESGDLTAFRQADKDADKLRQEMQASQETDGVSEDQRAEDFADWGKANKWYAENSIMQAYADAQASKLAKGKGGFLDRADLDAVSEAVKAKFPEEFEETPAPRQKKPHVDTGGQRQHVRGGRTYNDLPQDARQMCDKWTKQGLMTRDDYVRNYQWS